MEVIKIKFYGNVIYVSFVNNYNGNINTCGVTENNEFLFTKDYFEHSLHTINLYVKPLILQNKVKKIILTEKRLLELFKEFINLYSTINELYIEEEEKLTIDDIKNIISLPHIKTLNCYHLSGKDYYDLTRKYNKKVNLRSEVLFESNLMIDNKIDTLSRLYDVNEIVIKNELDDYDREELEYLLKYNYSLEVIVVNKNLIKTIEYLSTTVKNNIKINIINDNKLTEKEFKYLKNIKKNSKTDLELSYSKDYKQKNALKQLNLNLLRLCMILVVFVCVGFISAEKFIFETDKKQIEQIEYPQYEENIEEMPQEPIEEPVEEVIEKVEEHETPTSTYVSPYYKNYTQIFTELKQINPDTVGWIKVNNTNINYPVVKSTDNDYYLTHSFDKTANSFGWIYADYRSNFNELNQNTILYGHHVLGTALLFSTLTKTIEPSWYNNESNMTITFNIEQGNMKWRIFSIYLIPVTNDYLITNFNSQESFLNFVQKMKDRSVKDFGVEVLENDKILTLSTCYKDSSNRVVIHAKRVS